MPIGSVLTPEEEAALRLQRSAASRLPGVGAPGSTAATDQANIQLGDALNRADQIRIAQPATPTLPPAMEWARGFQPSTPTADVLRATRSVPDLVDGAIEGRRQALATAIQSRTDPDAPALYVSPRRHAELVHELGVYNDAAHQNAISRAQDAHQTFVQDQTIKSANEFTDMLHDIASIKAPPGTKEYHDAVMQIAPKYPNGIQTRAAQSILRTVATTHDNVAPITPPGMVPASVTVGPGGQSTTYRPIDEGKKETAGFKQFEEEISGLGLKPYDFENKDKWEYYKGRVVRVPEPIDKPTGWVGKPVVLDEAHYQRLQKKYDALAGRTEDATAAKTPVKNDVLTQAEYDALPAGAEFVFNGKRGRKPK